jgi:hypothetical protein
MRPVSVPGVALLLDEPIGLTGLVGGMLLASGIVATRLAPTMAAGPRRD